MAHLIFQKSDPKVNKILRHFPVKCVYFECGVVAPCEDDILVDIDTLDPLVMALLLSSLGQPLQAPDLDKYFEKKTFYNWIGLKYLLKVLL